MTVDYRMYLLSDEWQLRRLEALRAAGFRCERCGWISHGLRGLEVHHRTYERLGQELPADLEVLCRLCHAEEHGIALFVDNWWSIRDIARGHRGAA